jgi:AhpD family alkylhydroperoxidase
MVVPEALNTLLAFADRAKKDAPSKLLTLVHLRASQINGCAYCVDMHAREMKQAGESDERIWGVAGWHDSHLFSDAERAVLALTEATTRLADKTDAVPDEIWDDVAKHFDERAISSIVLNIGLINLFNRVNVATRQPPAAAR